jgi:HEAT repeat protein
VAPLYTRLDSIESRRASLRRVKAGISIRRALGLGVVLGAGAACSPAAPARAALAGDLPALKAAVATAQSSGELGRARVNELARAVLRRELMSAQGADVAARIDELGGCVDAAESSLSERAQGDDESAAEARLLLVDRKKQGADTDAAADPRPELRAVSARAATAASERTLRVQLMLDGDQRVRRAALSAAREARDPADVEALLEAARLDPDAEVQSRAALALGGIGGVRAVLGLSDRWQRADDDLRLSIVEAWSQPDSFAAGGQGELVRAAELAHGLPALAAALVLAEQQAGPPGLADGLLVRAIADGSVEERRFVLRLVPWTVPGVPAAVHAASLAGPDAVRVVALARRLDAEGSKPETLTPLRELARARSLTIALQARAALAVAGDASVKPLLESDLKAESAGQRRLGAYGLIRLGDFTRAASALADDSPSVRTQVACRVLTARN